MKNKLFNVLTLILVLLIVIGSLGASQVKANDGSFNKNDFADQTEADDIYPNLLTAEDSLPYFPNGIPEQVDYSGKEMPQAAAGVQRMVFSAADFQPFNAALWDRYTPGGHGCIAVRVPDSSGDYAHDATIPLPFTLGTQIVGMWVTGYDSMVGENSTLIFSLEWHEWDGSASYHFATGESPDQKPFNIWIPANNRVVEIAKAYYVKIKYFPTWGTMNPDNFKVCQITVEYIPPSPFVLAIPTVVTKP